MENKNINDLRRELKQLSPQQLADMLRRETEKETPDDDLVLEALHILEERDAEAPAELGPASEKAWETYRQQVESRSRKPVLQLPRFVKVASIILIVGVLLVFVPQQASAGSIWKILTDWTADFFQYVNIGGEATEPEEYVFETDNPGLQQVYEAVVEHLGVTDPVVVQWLPEGNELESLKLVDTDGKKAVYAYFVNNGIETVLAYNKMEVDRSPQYDKSDSDVKAFEKNGIIHSYMRNESVWSVSWARQNIKCSISIDCQEDVLLKIIRSIY